MIRSTVNSDMRLRLIGRSAFPVAQNTDTVEVDLSGLIEKLILFDKYILQSIRLKEIPALIRFFGYQGTKDLFSSGAIDIHCQALTIGQIGQTAIDVRRKKGFLPLGSYSFATVGIEDSKKFGTEDHRDFIHDCLQVIHNTETLRDKEAKKLKSLVASRLVNYPENAGNQILEQLKSDLRSNIPTIKTAVLYKLREKFKSDVVNEDFYVRVNPIDEVDFHVESNISNIFDIDEKEKHEIIESALLAIGGLNQRILDMKIFSALSGFRENELPLFDSKLGFIEKNLLGPENHSQRLNRVISLSNLPDIRSAIHEKRLDVNTLLEIRESPECKEFRQWLWSIDSYTDRELKDRIHSLREQFSRFVRSTTGKSIRWVAITGAGMTNPDTGPLLSASLSLLDTFVVEKLLPTSGALTFLNQMYPSIFRRR